MYRSLRPSRYPIGETIINRQAYKAGPATELVTVQITFSLDHFPGWGDCIDDHLNLLFQSDLYVQSATVLEPADADEEGDPDIERIKADLNSAMIL